MASAKIIELNETNTCKICDNALGRYSCPRCNILYCSLDCYQAPSHLQCSEAFYKECIMEEMSGQEDGEEKQRKMWEILQRTQENNLMVEEDEELDSDDDEFVDLAERMAGVCLDNSEEVWQKLTDDERQEFVAFLSSNEVHKLIEPWEPWWIIKQEKVQEVAENASNNPAYPPLVHTKPLSELTSAPPSDFVQYNLGNVLAGYAFTTRYFNGEHFDYPGEAVGCICAVSVALGPHNFSNWDTAFKSVEQQCINSAWLTSDEDNYRVMHEDVVKILRGRPTDTLKNSLVLYALSDLIALFKKALKLKCPDDGKEREFSSKFLGEHMPKIPMEPPGKMRGSLRKLEYFLSFVQDFTFDLGGFT